MVKWFRSASTVLLMMQAAMPFVAAQADTLPSAIEIGRGTASSAVARARGASVARPLADWKRDRLTTDDFGVPKDGVTDAAPQLQAALTAVARSGGGPLVIAPNARILIASQDVLIPANVTLTCDVHPGATRGLGGNNFGDNPYYDATPCTILESGTGVVADTAESESLRACDPLSGAGTCWGGHGLHVMANAALTDVIVGHTGLVQQRNFRDQIANHARYGGVGITIGSGLYGKRSDGANARIENVFIYGFDLGIRNFSNEGHRISNVKIDCNNGVLLDHITDFSQITDVEAYPYRDGDDNGLNVTSWKVTAATDNGAGLIRLTYDPSSISPKTQVGPDLGIHPGDVLSVILGLDNAIDDHHAVEGYYTVAAAGGSGASSYIDLAGSKFAGAYTRGGAIYFNAIHRAGTAFTFVRGDGDSGARLSSLGYTLGFHVGEAWMNCLDCSPNGLGSDRDPKSHGIWLDDANWTTFNTGQVQGFGTSVVQTGTAHQQAANVLNNMEMAGSITSGQRRGYIVDVQGGELTLSNPTMVAGAIHVADPAAHCAWPPAAAGAAANPECAVKGVSIVGARGTGAGLRLDSAAELPLLTIGGSAMTGTLAVGREPPTPMPAAMEARVMARTVTGIEGSVAVGALPGSPRGSGMILLGATADQTGSKPVIAAEGGRGVFPDNAGVQLLYPRGEIAAYTEILPAAPVDGQMVEIECGQTIRALTVEAAPRQSFLPSGTRRLSPCGPVANGALRFRYHAALSAWIAG